MFVEAETDFGLTILRAHRNFSEPFVFSPISICLALSLLHTGANKIARLQIADYIARGANEDQLLQHYTFLTAVLNSHSHNVSSVSNNKFFTSGTTSGKFAQAYLGKIEKHYGVNNGGQEGKVVEEVVEKEEKTTPEIIYYGRDVKTTATTAYSTRMNAEENSDVETLMNELQLNATWDPTYNLQRTTHEPFSVAPEMRKLVEYLNDGLVFRDYAEDELFEALILNYSDPTYSLALFLPKKHMGLVETLQKFSARHFQSLLEKAKRTYLMIKFPVFRIDRTIDLGDVVERMGIFEDFNDEVVEDSFNVTRAVHTAHIEVTDGGRAVNLNMGKIQDASVLVDGAIYFKADHPFLFAVLRDRHPLYIGIFC
ncbi:unnamed protein product [Caenorhabditis auriculariae]|uniref:Serpin domain-containing protein n=1 Tax=Caenorhabditis auriculariae TaxID=2777116 RepID=A0A8S1HA81_9PELO|nr:unnamed protein product [Caenorhabditis auriculariae]